MDDIVVPANALVVLIGASGSGKSTFAARWFEPPEILSSDTFRARVGRGEHDQQATGRAFRALHIALEERLAMRSLALVDATNIRSADRRALVRRAAAAAAPAIAIVLDVELGECFAGDLARSGRHVDRAVIERQWTALRLLLDGPDPLAGEGFSATYRLRGHTGSRSAVVRREAPP
jgi:protein phosphatase